MSPLSEYFLMSRWVELFPNVWGVVKQGPCTFWATRYFGMFTGSLQKASKFDEFIGCLEAGTCMYIWTCRGCTYYVHIPPTLNQRPRCLQKNLTNLDFWQRPPHWSLWGVRDHCHLEECCRVLRLCGWCIDSGGSPGLFQSLHKQTWPSPLWSGTSPRSCDICKQKTR